MSILVVGGAGCLGRAFLRKFGANLVFPVVSADLAPCDEANVSVLIGGGSCTQAATGAATKVKEALESSSFQPPWQFDTIVCTAGAFSGGSLATSAGLESVDRMWQANVKSAVATAHLATKFLSPGGLVVFTGAGAALGPCPDMVRQTA
mmetsp:Transcript_33565/g.75890  ORF Transcript_33565/g.75890 Transcript_33565/m.75890 type:complete len:149 (+) Transcript_33565:39-485(+)